MSTSPLGASLNRIDGRLKVTGSATYAADVNPGRLAYGYMVTSTRANATLESMDVAEARRSPGVLAVYTPFEPLKIIVPYGPFRTTWAPLQDREVHYRGQPIGFVVAETFEQARDAAMTVRAQYRERPPVTSLEDGIPGAATPPRVDGEPAVLTFLEDGVATIEEALAAAERVVTATYTTVPQGHSAMEPHSAVADWKDGALTVYSGNQGASLQAADLAGALGVEVGKVRAINPFVGGAFGGKVATYPPTLLAAVASRALGRPVKAVLSREQNFAMTATRPATVQKVTLGARRDGTLTALRHDAWSSSSVILPGSEASAHHSSRSWYAAANIGISQKIVSLNVPPTTIMRAPGEATGGWALETAMDELAVELGVDPIALRMKNYATRYLGRDVPYSSKHLDECYSTGARRFGWDRRLTTPRARLDGEWYVGMGMATAIYPAYRFPASMMVRMHADGSATVSGSTGDPGTGMWTVLSIMGAETLGLPIHRVRGNLGDSTLTPGGFVAASSSTASVGSAIMAAAELVKRELVELAITDTRSPFHGRPAEDVRYQNGDLLSGGRRLGFATLLRTLGLTGVEAVGSSAQGPEARDHAFASFGAQFCEVRVNRWTMEPRVTRMLAVMDAGTIVNAKTARSQIIGGMVWGLSAALHEGLDVERDGRLANGNLAEYLLPVNADVREIDAHFLDHPDLTFNPVGARGIGEIGVVGMAAAVGNAIFNATGKRLRALPMTIEALLA
ncbi:xanthine dehydrogenase family protein molybdopterin-binding subunit [Sphaerisporangium aureirubrum]|uniref:Xanthine dehydrogenase family protein molybdopterin-binding subunit n=1 Tax=Sphaerisporangium aureirubrum TaxID=1544736 RepID=A0ABW1NK05_9ACTN